MPLPTQTVTLLKAARQLHNSLPADAILLVHDAPIDWDDVRELLTGCRILVMSQNRALAQKVKDWPDIELIDNDPDPRPIEERLSCLPALMSSSFTTALPPNKAGLSRLTA
jgi:diadenylate cyclase